MIEFQFEQVGAKLGTVLPLIKNGIQGATPRLLMRAAQHAEGEIRETVMRRFDGKTGALARSWRSTFLGREGTVFGAAAHSDLKYARILDEGGVITPKTVKHLAIPDKDARVPVGKWPRHWPKGALRFIPAFGGRPPMLARTVGRNKKLVPVYWLVKSVRIKPAHYILYAATHAQPVIEEIMGEGLQEAVAKGVSK